MIGLQENFAGLCVGNQYALKVELLQELVDIRQPLTHEQGCCHGFERRNHIGLVAVQGVPKVLGDQKMTVFYFCEFARDSIAVGPNAEEQRWHQRGDQE